MTLGFDWRKKFFVGWQYPLCVLLSLFRTIPIWENKQKHRATSETAFKNVNVSWCTFLGFHNHLRGNLHWTHLRPSKRVFERTWPLGLTGTRNFFVGWQYPLCVLASLFGTMPIWENKQKHRATSETVSKNVNVSWCTFLGFHNHLRGSLH